MKKQAVRLKSTIWDEDGKKETFSSINKAKKRSREIQLAGKGLGRGNLTVVKP